MKRLWIMVMLLNFSGHMDGWKEPYRPDPRPYEHHQQNLQRPPNQYSSFDEGKKHPARPVKPYKYSTDIPEDEEKWPPNANKLSRPKVQTLDRPIDKDSSYDTKKPTRFNGDELSLDDVLKSENGQRIIMEEAERRLLTRMNRTTDQVAEEIVEAIEQDALISLENKGVSGTCPSNHHYPKVTVLSCILIIGNHFAWYFTKWK